MYTYDTQTDWEIYSNASAAYYSDEYVATCLARDGQALYVGLANAVEDMFKTEGTNESVAVYGDPLGHFSRRLADTNGSRRVYPADNSVFMDAERSAGRGATGLVNPVAFGDAANASDKLGVPGNGKVNNICTLFLTGYTDAEIPPILASVASARERQGTRWLHIMYTAGDCDPVLFNSKTLPAWRAFLDGAGFSTHLVMDRWTYEVL